MPKFKVNQKFSNGSKNVYLSSADEATAQTAVAALCEGEITVQVEATGVVTTLPTETAVAYKRVEVSLSNSAGTKRTFLKLLIKSTKSADDVQTALMNKDINGVHVDKVSFNNIVAYTV